MRIALLCATRRGYLFLKKLIELLPHSELVVFSFRDEPWEPPFLNDLRELALFNNSQFFEGRQVSKQTRFWESTEVDLMLVVGWRYLIPPDIFRRPRLGTFVFHDSLLPEYRGFSPTVWAIINGEDHTGVTLFEITEDIDAGDIVAQQRVPIGPDDTIAVVIERVTQTYLHLLEQNLETLISGLAPRYCQDQARATYVCKRLLEDNRIDWAAASEKIYNLVRAVSNPYPGAYTYVSGQKLRIWSAQRLPGASTYVGRVPGRIVEVRPGIGSVVLTGDGALLLTRVQPEKCGIVCAAELLNSLSQTLGP